MAKAKKKQAHGAKDVPIKKFEDLESGGKMIFLYGETGGGKTTSSIATAPKPCLYVGLEKRPVRDNVIASGVDTTKVAFMEPETWLDFFHSISRPEKFEGFNSIIIDSHSYIMNELLGREIEDEGAEASPNSKKPITTRVKTSLEGYGALSGWMRRLDHNLGILARKHGKVVICMAGLQENPKWDDEVFAGPLLKGQEYPRNMPQAYDLIGLVRKSFTMIEDAKGIKRRVQKFPPMVYFSEHPKVKGRFTCKWAGVHQRDEDGNVKPVGGPLDISAVLKMSSGELKGA